MELKFDMANDKYRSFIEMLRDKVRDPDTFSHGRPILPLENYGEAHVEVKLQEGSSDKSMVRISRHDLRLIRYRKPGGIWLDITDFGLYYNSRLVDLDDLEPVGPLTLVKAVNFLADPERNLTDVKERKGVRLALLVLSILLCEATKLDVLLPLFAVAFESSFEVPLHPLMLKFMSDWEDLSKELLEPYHDDEEGCDYFIAHSENAWHEDWRRLIGVTCQDVARCLGILRRTLPSAEMSDEPVRGTCLAEIHSVLVFIHGVKNGHVFGTVKVKDGFNTYIIYQRNAIQCEPIVSNDTLPLEGPRGFIICDDFLDVEVDLMERDRELQVSKGKMHWSSYYLSEDERDDLYDTRRSALIRGKNGYAIVFYTVFEKAVQATVEVTLVTNQGGETGHVCLSGSLVARYSGYAYITELQQNYYESKLFDKPMHNGECKQGKVVEVGVPIELPRPVVTVPVSSSLILKASLTNCMGDPILNGSVEIKPKEQGTSSGVIGRSEETHLLVKVTWRKYNYGCLEA